MSGKKRLGNPKLPKVLTHGCKIQNLSQCPLQGSQTQIAPRAKWGLTK